jgi:plastocyanin
MKPRPLTSPLVVIAATALLAAGCGGDSKANTPPRSTATTSGSASGGSGDAVTIDNFKFSPATLTVTAGTRITVTNDDSTAHTATADDGNSFDTGTLDPGASRTIAVPKAGSYAYHCSIHPFMKATIVAK